MKKRNQRRNLTRGVVLGLAAAALVVPTAQAHHEGGLGPKLARTTDSNAAYYRALALRSEGLNQAYRIAISPDDRAGVRGPGAPVSTPTVVSTPGAGFDWTDAGVGAGGAVLAIVLLTGGLWIVSRRTSRGQLAV